VVGTDEAHTCSTGILDSYPLCRSPGYVEFFYEGDALLPELPSGSVDGPELKGLIHDDGPGGSRVLRLRASVTGMS
jgi:hypothetical protein